MNPTLNDMAKDNDTDSTTLSLEDSDPTGSSTKTIHNVRISEPLTLPASSRPGSSNDQPKREENPFSFKHFLNTSNVTNSSSSPNIVQGSTRDDTLARIISNQNGTLCSTTVTTSVLTTTIMSGSSTKGARPKVPQQSNWSNLPSSTSSSAIPTSGGLENPDYPLKMKRSPRFLSFDSQASLTDSASTQNDDQIRRIGNFGRDSHNVQRSRSNYDIDGPTYGMNKTKSKSNSGSGNFIGSSTNRVNTEFSAALPDFVQDHLVMEQWYNNSNSTDPTNLTLNLEGLPDFASPESATQPLSGSNSRYLSSSGTDHHQPMKQRDIPFDLMCDSMPPMGQQRNNSPSLYNPYLESLPSADIPNNQGNRPEFIMDINNRDEYNPDQNRIPTQQRITLPDFLSDGPISTSGGRLADVVSQSDNLSPNIERALVECPNCRSGGGLSAENDRLKQEIDNGRKIVSLQIRRINDLERTVSRMRQNEAQYNSNISENLDRMEVNADVNNKRITEANKTIGKLKDEIRELNAEIRRLREENNQLKEEGAVGGVGACSYNRPLRNQQLAKDLLIAAATAETNLKQLLHGVDNLRVMAAAIDNMDTVEKSLDREADSDDSTSFTGPAL